MARFPALVAVAAGIYPVSLFLLSASRPGPMEAARMSLEAIALAAACALLARQWPLARVVAVVALLWLALCVQVAGPSAALAFLLSGTAALAIGARLLVRLQVFSPIERAVLAYLVGMAVITAALSPLLHLAIHYPGVYAVLCAAICLWQRVALRDLAVAVIGQWQESRAHRPTLAVAIPSLLAVAIWVYGALGTLTPIASYDDLAGHLRMPYELLVRHRYTFDVSHQLWAAAPWATDLAFSIPFVISQGNEGVKTWVAGSYHLAVATLLLGMLLRRLSAGPAMVFLMAYLSIPLVLAANHTLHTEALSAALVLAVFALWALQRHSAAPGVVISASLMLALLGSIKASNLVACLLLGLLWLPSMWRQARARPAVALGIVVALATVATPYVIAWVRTGNPVLPLFNAVFKSPYFESVNFSNSRFAGMFGPGLFASLFLSGARHLETTLATSGGLTLFFLLPSTVILLLWRGDLERRFALLVTVAYALVLLSSQQYLRYLFPVMGLAVLAATAVWDEPGAAGRTVRLWRGWWLAVLTVAIGIDTFSMPAVFWQTPLPRILQSLGPSGRAAYLASFAPERELTRAANQDLGVHATVFYGGDPYGADLHGTPIYPNWYNRRAESALAAVTDQGSAAEFVRRMHLTHVISPAPINGIFAGAQAATQELELYARAHGRVIATSANGVLVALNDELVWTVTLWRLSDSQVGSPIAADTVLTGSSPVKGGAPVLLELQGDCDGPQARPSIDVFWTRKGVLVDKASRVESCLPQGGRPQGSFMARHRLEAPPLADSVQVRLAGRNETSARVKMAQLRTLAP